MHARADYRSQDLPPGPGVYVFRNRAGKVIYVGKAKSLRKRVASYFQPSRSRTADPKLRGLINSISYYELFPVHTESEALLLESRLIKEYTPYYNVMMRDDKRFLLIAVDLDEPLPRAVLTRLKKDDGRRYFGPFPRGGAARQTVRYLSAFFGIRMCRPQQPDAETRRHCLDSIIRKCSRPCDGSVDPAAYRQRVDAMLQALAGETHEVEAALERDMKKQADARRYEDAARLRDILENLRYVAEIEKRRTFERASLIPCRPVESNVAALQKALGLARPPSLIECFDISNIGGTLAVAGLVCFRDGKPCRQGYRRFKIKTVAGSDDFAMMREAISRRYGRLMAERGAMPDLIIVDGGKGQLGAALQALRDLQVPALPVLGLAKKQEEVFLPGRPEPVVLERNDPALHLLQAARDEAHRFAVAFHRELRRKRIADSVLAEIDGIGRQRQEQLLRAFGSVARLRRASAAAIAAAVPGLGLATAERILAKIASTNPEH